MNKSVSTVRGNNHDARYLAVIDELTCPGQATLSERLEHWHNWDFSAHPEPANVWVARIGGLYVGYLAVENSQIYELRVQERYDVATISGLLLARSNLQIELDTDQTTGLVVA